MILWLKKEKVNNKFFLSLLVPSFQFVLFEIHQISGLCHTGMFQSGVVLQRVLELMKSHAVLTSIFLEMVSYKGEWNLILC